MPRAWRHLAALPALLLFTALLLSAHVTHAPPRSSPPQPETTATGRAPEEADCSAAGCGAAPRDTGGLTDDEIEELLAAMARENGTEHALETLLFHGDRTRDFVATRGTALLDTSQRADLLRELSRTHVVIQLKFLDDAGVKDEHGVHLALDEVVPIGEKQHLHADAARLGHPEMSFTVERVGRRHLWIRL